MPITDELEAFRAVLSCIQADGRQVSHVLLEEKDPIAKLKKLTLSELNSQILVFATDEARKIRNAQGQTLKVCMSPLLSETADYAHNKACDAVLIRKSELGIEIYYIDLKSDAPGGFIPQFQSTQCFMRYLCDLIKTFCKIEVLISKERFIVFHTDSKNGSQLGLRPKTRFSPKSANQAAAPDMRCVRNGDTVRCTDIF